MNRRQLFVGIAAVAGAAIAPRVSGFATAAAPVLSVVEIDHLLQAMWDANRISPTHMLPTHMLMNPGA